MIFRCTGKTHFYNKYITHFFQKILWIWFGFEPTLVSSCAQHKCRLVHIYALNFRYYKRVFDTRFCAAWHPGIFSVMLICMCVCVCVCMCVFLSEGRIQLSVCLILDHTTTCETPTLRNSSRSQSHRVSVCGGSWASLSPLCLSVSLSLSLFFTVSKDSYIHRQQACGKQQISVEAETDRQMQSEIGSDFWEEVLDSCSMTGSHENVSAALIAHVISSKK